MNSSSAMTNLKGRSSKLIGSIGGNRMMFEPAHSGRPWQNEHNQLVEGMIFGRAAIYFDEVARRGSIRRASEFLNISASAVDRQIIQLEESMGLALFERTSKGLRLTAAGELLLGSIRSWRRDLTRTQTQLDDLIGLRRGEVSIALVEGASGLFQNGLALFHAQYPGIVYQVELASARDVVAKVRAGEADLGLAFNPPEIQELRLEETVIYGLGLVVPRSHPLASRQNITLSECAQYPLVVPDHRISLRDVIDQAWVRTIGGQIRPLVSCNSIEMIKSFVRKGIGLGILTALDMVGERGEESLSFVELRADPTPCSVLTLISASGRTLSAPASQLIQCVASVMADTRAREE